MAIMPTQVQNNKYMCEGANTCFAEVMAEYGARHVWWESVSQQKAEPSTPLSNFPICPHSTAILGQ